MADLDALWSSARKFIKDRVVLVAESNPHLRSITRTILLQLGVKAAPVASDGFEAIDAICTFDPCALILDWGIRGMDAREVVRVVRTSGVVPDPKMPIIAISDPVKRSKVVEAKDLGVDHLLLRPISPMLMQQRLFPALMKLTQPPPLLKIDSIGLLTPKNVADALQVSTSWLAKARALGNGPPYIRLGRCVRYREASLIQWTKSQLQPWTSTSEQQPSIRKLSSRAFASARPAGRR